MAGRLDHVDALLARIDDQLDERQDATPAPAGPTFTGGSTRPAAVARRVLGGHALRQSLAPLLPHRWRP